MINKTRHTAVVSFFCVLFGQALLFYSVRCSAQENIILITNPDAPISKLTRTEAANLFLGIGVNTHKLRPYDRKSKPLRKLFYRALANLSLTSIRAQWAKRVFTGKGKQPTMLAIDSIESTLEEQKVAVTYVLQSKQPKNTKTLLIIEEGEKQ